VTELAAFVLAVVVIGLLGIRLGMLAAPRIGRLIDREAEDGGTGDGDAGPAAR